MEVPKEFKECPICYCKDTVCRQACKDEPSIPSGTFVSLEKVVTPIQDPNKISLPQVKTILTQYDVCAKCGTRYCVRAELISVPVTVQHRSGNTFRGFGPVG